MPEEKVKTTGIWVNESKKGNSYLTMYIDDVKLLGFENPFKEKDNHPDFKLFTVDEEGNWTPVGAIWERRSKNDKDYLFIKVQLGDKVHVLRAFEVQERKSDKSPDLIAYFDEAASYSEKTNEEGVGEEDASSADSKSTFLKKAKEKKQIFKKNESSEKSSYMKKKYNKGKSR